LQKISAAMGEERKTARKKKAGAWRTAKNADAPDQRLSLRKIVSADG
jgi:hypothetical protein